MSKVQQITQGVAADIARAVAVNTGASNHQVTVFVESVDSELFYVIRARRTEMTRLQVSITTMERLEKLAVAFIANLR